MLGWGMAFECIKFDCIYNFLGREKIWSGFCNSAKQNQSLQKNNDYLERLVRRNI